MSGSASNSSSETHDSSTPRVQITESPRDSIIFTLARFVGTLVALASITILTVLILVLKALLVTVCEETFLGFSGILLIALTVGGGLVKQYSKSYQGGEWSLLLGILGGMDL